MSDLEVFQGVRRALKSAEFDGNPVVTIYTGSVHAYHCLNTWCRGWIRRAGPDGPWKDSKGMEKLIFSLKRNKLL